MHRIFGPSIGPWHFSMCCVNPECVHFEVRAAFMCSAWRILKLLAVSPMYDFWHGLQSYLYTPFLSRRSGFVLFLPQSMFWSFWPAVMNTLQPALWRARLCLYEIPPGMNGILALGLNSMPSLLLFLALLLLLPFALLLCSLSLWNGSRELGCLLFALFFGEIFIGYPFQVFPVVAVVLVHV